jgi:hypothetical protein
MTDDIMLTPSTCEHVESKWCPYVMVEEADSHPSIFGINKVFEYICMLSSDIQYQHYTVISIWFGSDLGVLGHLLNEMMSLRHGWGWQPPQTASLIHVRHIQSVGSHWYAVSTPSATKRVMEILEAKYDKANLPAIVRDNCSHLDTDIIYYFSKLSQIWGNLCGGNSVSVLPYPHPQLGGKVYLVN